MRVLNTISLDNFYGTAIAFHRELHPVYGITSLDLLENTRIPFREFRGLVETFFNGTKKTVLFV